MPTDLEVKAAYLAFIAGGRSAGGRVRIGGRSYNGREYRQAIGKLILLMSGWLRGE